MTTVHKNLTGSDLHESKGVDTALSGTVYVADGAGSGAWTSASSIITNQAWSTGDAKLTFNTSAPSGWILVNDGTIGDASSSATTRANADTSALFAVLYALPIGLTVSGGRGASAVADFAAHKTIQVPLFLGRVLGIAGAGSGLTSRAVGVNVGQETYTILLANLPAYTPTGTVATTITTGGKSVPSGAGFNTFTPGGGTAVSVSDGTNVTFTGTSTFTGTAQGGTSTAFSIMQPSTFLNLLIKL